MSPTPGSRASRSFDEAFHAEMEAVQAQKEAIQATVAAHAGDVLLVFADECLAVGRVVALRESWCRERQREASCQAEALDLHGLLLSTMPAMQARRSLLSYPDNPLTRG